MSYKITRSDPIKWPQITLTPLQVNTTATSLNLWGRGAINYGTLEQANFVHLLENFASPSEPDNPIEGQLWYDTSSDANKILKVYNVPIGATIGSWVTSANVGFGQTYPHPTQIGAVWYNTITNQLMVCTAVGPLATDDVWTPVSLSLVAPNAPLNPLLGMLWYDTRINVLNYWNNKLWEPLFGTIPYPRSSSGAHQPTGLPTGFGIQAGQLWFNTSDNLLEYYSGSTWKPLGVLVGLDGNKPQNPQTGQFFFNQTPGINALQYWNGTTWEVISSTSQSTGAPPTPAKIGQLWYNPSTHKLMVYDGTWKNVVPDAPPTNWAVGIVFS